MKQYLRIIKAFLSFVSNESMTRNIAAGLMMCRISEDVLQYFLVHPGGPYFKTKDVGVWSIPKGIPEQGEDLLQTATREFFEETGIKPTPPFHDIGLVKQKGGKVVYAWTFSGEWNSVEGIRCNSFRLEWPPRSGKVLEFPEVDQGRWMHYQEAIRLINPAQIPFLDRSRSFY